MAVLGDLLFYRSDMAGLGDVLRHKVEELRAAVDALPDTAFAQKSDAELAAHVAREQTLAPLVVDFASAKAAVVETDVEIRDQFGFRGGGSISVPGLQATKTIPFTGDPDLWQFHAGSFSMDPPRGEVRPNVLVIGMSVPAQQADHAAQYIEQTIAQLPATIAQQKVLIDEHNASLAGKAMTWILARRQRQDVASDLLRKLGG